MMNKPFLRLSPDGEGASNGRGGASDSPAEPVTVAGDPPAEANQGDPADEHPAVKALRVEREQRKRAERELAETKRAQADANKTVEEQLADARREAAELRRSAAIAAIVREKTANLTGFTVDTARVAEKAAKLNVPDDELDAEIAELVEMAKRPAALRTPGDSGNPRVDRDAPADKAAKDYSARELTDLWRTDRARAERILAERQASFGFGVR